MQANRHLRIVRVAPDACLQEGQTFLRTTRKHQRCAKPAMGAGQVWRHCQRSLGLGHAAVEIRMSVNDGGKTNPCLRIIAVQCDRTPRQWLGHAFCIS
jgi:hypothetical protein